jgi:DNA-directed RNA polymerase specialized sigma24 family protein
LVTPGRQPRLERVLKQTRNFEDFYAANYGKITALVAAVLGDRSEADDIAQEAFTRALARWPRVSQLRTARGHDVAAVTPVSSRCPRH